MQNRAEIQAKIKNARGALEFARSSLDAMPSWPAGCRIMPIDYITLGVFGAPRPSARVESVTRRQIFGADGRSVRYTGFLMSQAHADVLMTVLDVARGRQVGEVARVELVELERRLGRSRGVENREALQAQLAQLTATCIDVTEAGGRRWFGGSLLPWRRWDGSTLEFEVNAELAEFMLLGFRRVDIAARQRLARKPLAQWLQLRLLDEPHDWLELEGLQSLSRASGERREFRRSAGAACEALDAARAGVGRWRVGGDAGELLVRAA